MIFHVKQQQSHVNTENFGKKSHNYFFKQQKRAMMAMTHARPLNYLMKKSLKLKSSSFGLKSKGKN